MRLVIDLQVIQHYSISDKIAQYFLTLIKNFLKQNNEIEVFLVLKNRNIESIESIRNIFRGLLLRKNIVVFPICQQAGFKKLSQVSLNKLMNTVRSEYVKRINPDLIYIIGFVAKEHNYLFMDRSCWSKQSIYTVIALYDETHKPWLNLYPDYQIHFLHLIPPLTSDPLLNIACLKSTKIYQGHTPIKKFSDEKSLTTDVLALHSAFEKAKNLLNYKGKNSLLKRKLRLAYVSPLPPLKTGISEYSLTLLAELRVFYEITIILDQKYVSELWVEKHFPMRSVKWFEKHADSFDRILYHIGNSPFHQSALELLKKIKGTVILHDYYLWHVMKYISFCQYQKFPSQNKTFSLTNAIYNSHGYQAVLNYFQCGQDDSTFYPVNLSVLSQSNGIIFHSKAAKLLHNQWYDQNWEDHIEIIPILHSTKVFSNRIKSRSRLKINEKTFLVCSFGMVTPNKLSHRLLEAWHRSLLSKHKDVMLVYVGACPDDKQYINILDKMLSTFELKHCVKITGWVDKTTYHDYLAAADMAVQLRKEFFGESSYTLLNCFNYSIPTITNNVQSLEENSADNVVVELPIDFQEKQLVDALEELWRNKPRRMNMGRKARNSLKNNHCSKLYTRRCMNTIEKFYARSQSSRELTLKKISCLQWRKKPKIVDLKILAKFISYTCLPVIHYVPRIFIDVSHWCQQDGKTGIERVIRALLLELIKNPPAGYRVEPVYFVNHAGLWNLYFARIKTLSALGVPSDWVVEDVVEIRPKDCFLGLDYSPDFVKHAKKLLTYIHSLGVKIMFLVYDLLPITHPTYFPNHMQKNHQRWINIISNFSSLFCISKTVSEEIKLFLEKSNDNRCKLCKIRWFHLGADIEASLPTQGLPDHASFILSNIQRSLTFLVVGTVEPRKGHIQTLAAFKILWEKGMDINLVIVGKQGWCHEYLDALKLREEINSHLLWLENCTDTYIQKIYMSVGCLIMTSEAEGFGLPLIEAAKYKLPIIARDIPVFREVAREHAYYFKGCDSIDLVEAIESWMLMYEQKTHPKTDNMPWLTWHESANQLKELILEE